MTSRGPSPLRPGEYTIHDLPPRPPGDGKVPPISKLLLLVGSLPLITYPFVVLAVFMSFAGDDRTPRNPSNVHWLIYIFHAAALAYPLVYGACVVIVRALARHGTTAFSAITAAFPIIYVLLIVNLFFWLGTHVKS